MDVVYSRLKTIARALAIQLFGFIDEHNRNTIFNFIFQTAFITDQSILALVQVNIAFAFRAYEYVQQFLANGHNILPLFRID